MILSTTALILVVNAFTSVMKRWVYPRFGSSGVHVVAFALATIGSLYAIYGGEYPGLVKLVGASGMVFSTAVAFYEVVLKNIDVFKVVTPEMTEARLK